TKNDLACLQSFPIGMDFVCEPSRSGCGMVQNRCGDAGFFNHSVSIAQGSDPTQIDVMRSNRPTAKNDTGVCRIVGNCVEYLAGLAGRRVYWLNPLVDDLDCRNDMISRIQHVEDRAVWPFQWRLENEGEFKLDARKDESRDVDVAARLEDHIVQQRAIVRL